MQGSSLGKNQKEAFDKGNTWKNFAIVQWDKYELDFHIQYLSDNLMYVSLISVSMVTAIRKHLQLDKGYIITFLQL